MLDWLTSPMGALREARPGPAGCCETLGRTTNPTRRLALSRIAVSTVAHRRSRTQSAGPYKGDSQMLGCFTGSMTVTIYGVCALTFMMGMYALEKRGPRYVIGFAVGCLLSSAYGFLSGAWPFGIVEFIWSGVAVARFRSQATDTAAPRR
jgi:hypothetical protein